jgi:hypothetical protein
LLKSVNLHRQDTLASFDVVSLLTNVPVGEALQVIRNMLENDNTLAERSVLKVESIVELLDVCLRTTYFQVDDGFYQQKDGMAMGSSLSPIVSNIYMEHFEHLALDSAQDKSSLWLRYVDDTFVIWHHGAEGIRNSFTHLNGPSWLSMRMQRVPVGWDEAGALEIESNSRYRNYKESANMACSINSISQPS